LVDSEDLDGMTRRGLVDRRWSIASSEVTGAPDRFANLSRTIANPIANLVSRLRQAVTTSQCAAQHHLRGHRNLLFAGCLIPFRGIECLSLDSFAWAQGVVSARPGERT